MSTNHHLGIGMFGVFFFDVFILLM